MKKSKSGDGTVSPVFQEKGKFASLKSTRHSFDAWEEVAAMGSHVPSEESY